MQEYVTRAVVLDKQTHGGQADARYLLFTERYGKIAARAKSSRKIVSKLAGHLEPGTMTAVRIIETHGVQVVDALKFARVAISVPDLMKLNCLLGEWEPDAELWHQLAATESFFWQNILAILGWDPRGAICARCNVASRPAPYFYIPRQEFFCAQCAAASRFRQEELLLV